MHFGKSSEKLVIYFFTSLPLPNNHYLIAKVHK